MTKDQENKLDSIRDEIISMRGDFKMVDNHLQQHREAILQEVSKGIERDKKIELLQNDRNKVIGAIWVATSGFITAIIAFIISIFKHS